MALSSETRAYLRDELRRNRGWVRGAIFAVACALGSAGPDIVAFVQRVLS